MKAASVSSIIIGFILVFSAQAMEHKTPNTNLLSQASTSPASATWSNQQLAEKMIDYSKQSINAAKTLTAKKPLVLDLFKRYSDLVNRKLITGKPEELEALYDPEFKSAELADELAEVWYKALLQSSPKKEQKQPIFDKVMMYSKQAAEWCVQENKPAIVIRSLKRHTKIADIITIDTKSASKTYESKYKPEEMASLVGVWLQETTQKHAVERHKMFNKMATLCYKELAYRYSHQRKALAPDQWTHQDLSQKMTEYGRQGLALLSAPCQIARANLIQKILNYHNFAAQHYINADPETMDMLCQEALSHKEVSAATKSQLLNLMTTICCTALQQRVKPKEEKKYNPTKKIII